jgi:hypothetical protein
LEKVLNYLKDFAKIVRLAPKAPESGVSPISTAERAFTPDELVLIASSLRELTHYLKVSLGHPLSLTKDDTSGKLRADTTIGLRTLNEIHFFATERSSVSVLESNRVSIMHATMEVYCEDANEPIVVEDVWVQMYADNGFMLR